MKGTWWWVCVEVHVVWILLRGGAFGDEEEEEGRVYSNLHFLCLCPQNRVSGSMRWGEWQQIKTMARISSASSIRNLGHLCRAVGGATTLSRLLTRLVCPSCQFGSSVFSVCQTHQKHRKHGRIWNVCWTNPVDVTQPYEYLGEIWRLRQLHTWWCVLCIFASVFCMEKLYLNMRFQSWLGVDKYSFRVVMSF